MNKAMKAAFGLLPILLLVLSFAFASEEDDVLGKWITPEKDCKIEIFKCSDNYCGKIVWLREPDYPPDDKGGMAGSPVVDRENPDPDLRARPLVGLQLLKGLTYAGKSTWEKGAIYNPDNGKTYRCKMILSSPGRLEVRGFIGIYWAGPPSGPVKPDSSLTRPSPQNYN